MVTSKEHEARERFASSYHDERVEVVREIELRVIGADWGANGYTTLTQANGLADNLRLHAGDLLLDVGSGRGWPALYLAAKTECSVVLADVPLEGLTVAAARARTENLEELAWCVSANARDLPFRAASFDAIVHTDLLC